MKTVTYKTPSGKIIEAKELDCFPNEIRISEDFYDKVKSVVDTTLVGQVSNILLNKALRSEFGF